MSHTYADVSVFKAYLVSNGGTDFGTTDDAVMLAILEGASRRVEGYCDRSRFGSGFGPRVVASQGYDHDGTNHLELFDDFLTITSVTSAPTTGDTPVTLTATTDYLPWPSGVTQKRDLVFPFLGGNAIGWGYNVISVSGTAGYSNVSASIGAMGTATSGTVSITLTSGAAYPGATLLADAEQMYVTAATNGTALTVVRGANGTTAAAHAAGTTVYQFTYPAEVVSATLLVAQRRWRQKESGITGDFGGQIMGGQNRDTEQSILRGTVGHLRIGIAG